MSHYIKQYKVIGRNSGRSLAFTLFYWHLIVEWWSVQRCHKLTHVLLTLSLSPRFISKFCQKYLHVHNIVLLFNVTQVTLDTRALYQNIVLRYFLNLKCIHSSNTTNTTNNTNATYSYNAFKHELWIRLSFETSTCTGIVKQSPASTTTNPLLCITAFPHI